MGNNAGGIDQSIQELLRQLVVHHQNALVCKVTAVNGLACDCEPLNGEADILGVRLLADVQDEQFVLIPQVGSFVIVSAITNEDWFVSLVSKVGEVRYKIGTVYYSVTATGFLIQKDEDTLKQVLTLLIQAVQQIAVLYGNNPDYIKLAQALTMVDNLLQ